MKSVPRAPFRRAAAEKTDSGSLPAPPARLVPPPWPWGVCVGGSEHPFQPLTLAWSTPMPTAIFELILSLHPLLTQRRTWTDALGTCFLPPFEGNVCDWLSGTAGSLCPSRCAVAPPGGLQKLCVPISRASHPVSSNKRPRPWENRWKSQPGGLGENSVVTRDGECTTGKHSGVLKWERE